MEQNNIPDITDPKVRLGVYQKALEILKSGEVPDKYLDKWDEERNTLGLCLLLPCVWLNKSYMNKWLDGNGNNFYYQSTHMYFPEFGNIFNHEYNYNWTAEIRIEVLTRCIAQLS